jgi:hypothetical protein
MLNKLIFYKLGQSLLQIIEDKDITLWSLEKKLFGRELVD